MNNAACFWARGVEHSGRSSMCTGWEISCRKFRAGWEGRSLLPPKLLMLENFVTSFPPNLYNTCEFILYGFLPLPTTIAICQGSQWCNQNDCGWEKFSELVWHYSGLYQFWYHSLIMFGLFSLNIRKLTIWCLCHVDFLGQWVVCWAWPTKWFVWASINCSIWTVCWNFWKNF